jgi:hypothetical protein
MAAYTVNPSHLKPLHTKDSLMSLQSLSDALYFKRVTRQQAHGMILHYDAQAQALRPWYWYVDAGNSITGFDVNSHPRPLKQSGERVPPSEFGDYRATHAFTTPSCLCAQSGSVQVESSVDVTMEDPYRGEYVAGCALGRCDYLGESTYGRRRE